MIFSGIVRIVYQTPWLPWCKVRLWAVMRLQFTPSRCITDEFRNTHYGGVKLSKNKTTSVKVF